MWLNRVNLSDLISRSYAKWLWCHSLARRWLVLPLAGGAFKTVHRTVREVCAWLHKEASCQGTTAQWDDSVGSANPPAPIPWLVTALTLTLVLGSALGIVHPDSRKWLWLYSATLIWPLRMLFVHFSHTISHPAVPFRRLRNQVTWRLDDSTEKVSDTAKSSDTIWCYVYHGNKEKGGGGAQSFSGGKNKKPERF